MEPKLRHGRALKSFSPGARAPSCCGGPSIPTQRRRAAAAQGKRRERRERRENFVLSAELRVLCAAAMSELALVACAAPFPSHHHVKSAARRASIAGPNPVCAGSFS